MKYELPQHIMVLIDSRPFLPVLNRLCKGCLSGSLLGPHSALDANIQSNLEGVIFPYVFSSAW